MYVLESLAHTLGTLRRMAGGWRFMVGRRASEPDISYAGKRPRRGCSLSACWHISRKLSVNRMR